LGSRGGRTNYHYGNRVYRRVVGLLLALVGSDGGTITTWSHKKKREVACCVVNKLHELLGARFIQLKSHHKPTTVLMSHGRAVNKVLQRIREATPQERLPIIDYLEEQEISRDAHRVFQEILKTLPQLLPLQLQQQQQQQPRHQNPPQQNQQQCPPPPHRRQQQQGEDDVVVVSTTTPLHHEQTQDGEVSSSTLKYVSSDDEEEEAEEEVKSEQDIPINEYDMEPIPLNHDAFEDDDGMSMDLEPLSFEFAEDDDDDDDDDVSATPPRCRSASTSTSSDPTDRITEPMSMEILQELLDDADGQQFFLEFGIEMDAIDLPVIGERYPW